MERVCACCKEQFPFDSRHRHQRYCTGITCQRDRRNRWQKEKLRRDEDYRANQADAQRRWRELHPDYWKEYRHAHPAYVERNREQQKQRRSRPAALREPAASPRSRVAKMDVVSGQPVVASGIYQLLPVNGRSVAKMDVVMVQLIKIDGVA